MERILNAMLSQYGNMEGFENRATESRSWHMIIHRAVISKKRVEGCQETIFHNRWEISIEPELQGT